MENLKNPSLFKKLDELFVKALNDKVFSGASIAISTVDYGCSKRKIINYGFTHFNESKKVIDNQTFFDIASLTKPLVTVCSLLILQKEGEISINDPISKFYKNNNCITKDIKLWQLLSHSSGLPAHREYFNIFSNIPVHQRNEKIIQSILAENLLSKPGENCIYSDLGFILLGDVVEKVSGQKINEYWNNTICGPLGLSEELFFTLNSPENASKFAVTGKCGWSGKILKGIVHDDNCRFLGGIAGHAGLFGTSRGVAILCEKLLSNLNNTKDYSIFDKSELSNWVEKLDGKTWSLGFDKPTALGSSGGKYLSKNSIGHLGFTGVSFWIDIRKGVSISLLTNRVISEGDNRAIKLFRPRIHDTVMEYF